MTDLDDDEIFLRFCKLGAKVFLFIGGCLLLAAKFRQIRELVNKGTKDLESRVDVSGKNITFEVQRNPGTERLQTEAQS